MTSIVDSQVDILLIEDNPNDVELTLHALHTNNVTNRIIVLRDGAEALDFMHCTGSYSGRDVRNRPSVVLLDLKLPKVDGLEVLERLRSDPRTETVPIVALTSSAEEPDVRRAYELGVNSYIVKPVDFDQFTRAIRDLGHYWVILNQSPPQ